MNYAYLHFFNIQYWYCVLVSLFGTKCTYTDLGAATSVPAPTGTTASTTTHAATASNPGFWDWLFGIHSASGTAASSTPPGILGTVFMGIAAVLGFLWSAFSVIAYLASFLLFLIILLSLVGLFIIGVEDRERYGTLAPAPEKAHPLRGRWQALLDSAMSSDPKRWREALLGADALLGELFTALGYEGATTAEQIRRVPDSAFANLPAAWEAHRIRNLVSSPTSHFILTQREAFRVMKLYEQVFREFDFI